MNVTPGELIIHQDIEGITTRLIASVKRLCPTGERKKYQWLEAQTGVSASAWKNMMNRRQSATLAMVQVWVQRNPDLALWLLTGAK